MRKKNPEEFRIRQLCSEDMPEVVAIERECFAHPWDVEGFRGLIENPQFDCFGYFREELAGYLIDYFVAGELHILNVAVKPEQRRLGIAQMLFNNVLEHYSGLLDLVFLEVRKSNFPALEFYRKQGFCEVGLRKGYYPDGEDAILMTMKIKNMNNNLVL